MIITNEIGLIRHYLKEWFEQRNKKIFIVTQGFDVLLACNNELCIDGQWHKEWVKIPTAYFNKEDEKKSSYLKVLVFYTAHPELVPRIFVNKFANSFLKEPVAAVTILLIILTGLSYIQKWKITRRLFLTACILCFSYILLLGTHPLVQYQLLMAGIVILGLFTALLLHYKNGVNVFEQTFLTVFIGLLFIVFIFYGSLRIILPFYLLFCILIIEMGEKLLKITFISSRKNNLNH